MLKYTAIAAIALLAGTASAQAPKACAMPTDAQMATMVDQIFENVDADHDGRISQREMTDFITTHRGQGVLRVDRWKMADADHDGFLTKTEIVASIKQMVSEHCR